MDRWKNALHEAIYVYVDRLVVYVWHGGSYINTYDRDFNPLSCIGIDDKSQGQTAKKVEEIIERHIKEDRLIYYKELI